MWLKARGIVGPMRTLVVIESPLAGDYVRNRRYALACMKDSLVRGEAPFVMHLLYPLVLDDTVQAQRDLGIECGLAWARAGVLRAVYEDLGVSRGMKLGIEHARAHGQRIEYRRLGGEWTP